MKHFNYNLFGTQNYLSDYIFYKNDNKQFNTDNIEAAIDKISEFTYYSKRETETI